MRRLRLHGRQALKWEGEKGEEKEKKRRSKEEEKKRKSKKER